MNRANHRVSQDRSYPDERQPTPPLPPAAVPAQAGVRNERESSIGLPRRDRIATCFTAERLQQHAIEAEFAGITKLLDTNCHAVVARRRLGAVGAQQTVPPRQVEAEIAVGLAPQDRMMDAMHV